MNYGDALLEIRNGKVAALSVWNGETEKNTFIFLSGGFQANTPENGVLNSRGISSMYVNSRIDKRLSTGEVIYGWTPSQDEQLSEGWEILD